MKKYEWENNQVLQYADGTGVFAYLETTDEPVELDDGLVTENGFFWQDLSRPVRICSIMTGDLCSSYDEEPFCWAMFKRVGQGIVQIMNDQITLAVSSR